MKEISIKVEHLTKKYIVNHKLNGVKYKTLRESISNKFNIFSSNFNNSRQVEEDFYALSNISFQIEQGDVVGIIGRNGAGKSTLLKILSKITEPTTGKIILKGKVASLLEVGTGFHPELTGRENIFLNGAILGMSKYEIKKKFDEIVDFAGVEFFLDTPVKRYSSGMYVRLAFSVAAHLEPDILIVDEVLAVGDVEFQKKCLGKMQEVSKNQGRTVLFVSHNMGAVQTLCNKGLYLKNGFVTYQGTSIETIKYYMHDISKEMNQNNLIDRKDRKGNQKIKVNKITFYDKENHEVTEVLSGDYIRIKFDINITEVVDIEKMIVAVKLFDTYEQNIAMWISDEYDFKFSNNQYNSFSLVISNLNLRPGQYLLGFQISLNDTSEENFCDVMNNAIGITLLKSGFFSKDILVREGYSSLIPSHFIQ